MLGFDYVVFRGETEKLAMWSEVSSVDHWLDELVKAGRAKYDDCNGFPNTYTLSAADLLPHIDRLGKRVIYFESTIETFTEDEMLTVQAWDAG